MNTVHLTDVVKEMKNNEQKISVVLGGTGGIGSAVVRELIEKKRAVRVVTRNEAHAQELFKGMKVEIVQADMLSLEQTRKAVEGAAYVYHCIGIPYTRWLKDFPIIQKNIIEAMVGKEAVLAYADNLYMYGKANGEKIAEEHPQEATSKKGQLRRRLAEELLEKHKEGKLKTVVVRFGDFYGPNVVNGFTIPLFKNPIANKTASWIGDLEQKHSLIYIDDAAKGFIEATENPELYGKIWHIEGAEAVTGREFIEMIFGQLGYKPKMKVLKKGTISFLSPFVPIVKEIKELLDQWEHPFVIDGTKYREVTGINGYTSHKEAIARTLAWFEENN